MNSPRDPAERFQRICNGDVALNTDLQVPGFVADLRLVLADLADLRARAEAALFRASRRDQWRKYLIDTVLTDVCDLPDRTSPDDWPEAMIVTGEELSMIIERALERYVPSTDETPVNHDLPPEAWKLRAERAEAKAARLLDAGQDFMHAYRQKYARVIGGIRSNAPLRDEAKALVQAITATEKETEHES